MKTFAAFMAGIGLVVGFGLLWSMGTAGRIVAVIAVVGAALYGVFRLATYRPDYSRGAGTLDLMRGTGTLRPLDDDFTPPPAGGPDGGGEKRP